MEMLKAQEVTGLRARPVALRDDRRRCGVWRTRPGGAAGDRIALPSPGVPGQDDLIGAGVHFCATCDSPFYRDKPVAVIRGGNSASERACT
ncbi:MAG: hypothetical protein U0841_18875 [Chloroflexia bacterium]